MFPARDYAATRVPLRQMTLALLPSNRNVRASAEDGINQAMVCNAQTRSVSLRNLLWYGHIYRIDFLKIGECLRI